MMKKLITSLIISIILLFVSMNAKADAFTNNQIVDANKNWTIHFNQEVALDDLTKQNIVVTDSKGNNINVKADFGQDSKTIVVSAPKGGYLAGEKYTLTVGDKVHTKDNKNLKKSIALNFSVKDSLVTFKDENLEKTIRNVINKPSGNILKSDVEKITKLDLSYTTAAANTGDYGVTSDSFTIKDLSGIENLTNLQYLDVDGMPISDISKLNGLTNLQSLNLSGTEVTDISALKELTNLQSLHLDDNEIGSIDTLEGLTNLQFLYLANTKISDISALKWLTNLKDLGLADNHINDISALKDLTNLQHLDLTNVQISDISALKGLTNLEELDLDSAKLSDISVLKELTKLKSFYLAYSKVSDISVLKELTNLKKITLCGDHEISDSDIQDLKESLPECDISIYVD